jgi:hypothetical protein
MTMQEEPQTTADVAGIAELTLECWRLLRVAQRLVRDQSSDRQAGALAQIRYVRTRVEAILGARGLRLVAYLDEPYSPNLPVTVANADEFQGNERLVIAETLEPTLLADGHVVAMGKVILKQGE